MVVSVEAVSRGQGKNIFRTSLVLRLEENHFKTPHFHCP